MAMQISDMFCVADVHWGIHRHGFKLLYVAFTNLTLVLV